MNSTEEHTDADPVDQLLWKRREVSDRVYRAFLDAAGNVREEDWRLLAIECVMRLSGGLAASIHGDVLARDAGFARCAHCSMLIPAREIEAHRCKPEDLERVKKAMLAQVPEILVLPPGQPQRIALNLENFRALVEGKEVLAGSVVLLLSDIGFGPMLEAITQAGLAASEKQTDVMFPKEPEG